VVLADGALGRDRVREAGATEQKASKTKKLAGEKGAVCIRGELLRAHTSRVARPLLESLMADSGWLGCCMTGHGLATFPRHSSVLTPRTPRHPTVTRRTSRDLLTGEAGYKEVTLLGQNVDAYGRCAC
jgi:hypothetical protein